MYIVHFQLDAMQSESKHKRSEKKQIQQKHS